MNVLIVWLIYTSIVINLHDAWFSNPDPNIPTTGGELTLAERHEHNSCIMQE